MKFYNEDDMTDEKFNQFCKMIDEIEQKFAEQGRLLSENVPLKFNSIEEARAYYHSTPFEEWERDMFERLANR